METDISVKVLTTEDAWSSSEVQKAQLEDAAIRPIMERKLNSEDRPSWQEIAPESPATKRYWALWDSLHLKDGVLYPDRDVQSRVDRFQSSPGKQAHECDWVTCPAGGRITKKYFISLLPLASEESSLRRVEKRGREDDQIERAEMKTRGELIPLCCFSRSET
ncbi:hypothetical protein AVEN_262900-1 [Araneus ventricosus]|uniref:Uncharacterized protein n=1 Tax=Araneus ventricosus TaxID=182803 RepID=A0A4Y2DGB6_ARAVE|nr:hypothetical protein AVEN_262900-1 [Araneus ventricosus]